MHDPEWLASHTQYGGVQNDQPKIRIGVQVLNTSHGSNVSTKRRSIFRRFERLVSHHTSHLQSWYAGHSDGQKQTGRTANIGAMYSAVAYNVAMCPSVRHKCQNSYASIRNSCFLRTQCHCEIPTGSNLTGKRHFIIHCDIHARLLARISWKTLKVRFYWCRKHVRCYKSTEDEWCCYKQFATVYFTDRHFEWPAISQCDETVSRHFIGRHLIARQLNGDSSSGD